MLALGQVFAAHWAVAALGTVAEGFAVHLAHLLSAVLALGLQAV